MLWAFWSGQLRICDDTIFSHSPDKHPGLAKIRAGSVTGGPKLALSFLNRFEKTNL